MQVKSLDYKKIEIVDLSSNATTMFYNCNDKDEKEHLLKLSFENGDREIRTQKSILSIGRHREGDIVIEKNLYVAKIHAHFFFENNNWLLKDNDSKNGVWINDVKLNPNKKYVLHANDVITLANEKIIFFKSYGRVGVFSEKSYIENDIIGKIIKREEQYHYKIKDVISHNAKSTIYKVEFVQTGELYAIKQLQQKMLNDLQKKELLLKVDKLRECNHSGIRKYIDFFEDNEYLYIVMEYIEGNNLQSILDGKKEPFSINEVVSIGIQVAKSLQYLHTLDTPIVNKDIKPANLLLEEKTGKIKLIDFGIAIFYEKNQKQDRVPLGTRGFAAPEQYKADNKVDIRADIFALGMIMYYLITKDDPRKINHIYKPIREINPSLPEELEKIIDKCVASNPDMRYQDCRELIKEISKLGKNKKL